MSTGSVIHRIIDQHLALSSLLEAQLLRAATRSSQQWLCRALTPSTEERSSRPVKPFGFSGCCMTSESKYQLRSRSTAATTSIALSTLRCIITSCMRGSRVVKLNFAMFEWIDKLSTSSPSHSNQTNCTTFRRCLGYNILTCGT